MKSEEMLRIPEESVGLGSVIDTIPTIHKIDSYWKVDAISFVGIRGELAIETDPWTRQVSGFKWYSEQLPKDSVEALGSRMYSTFERHCGPPQITDGASEPGVFQQTWQWSDSLRTYHLTRWVDSNAQTIGYLRNARTLLRSRK